MASKARGAGDLDKRITFQVVTRTHTSGGADSETWTDAFERWAEYAPKHSSEFFEVQQRHAEVKAVFVIRYDRSRDIGFLFATPENYRIVYVHDQEASPINEQLYDIYPPIPEDGGREWLLIGATDVRLSAE